MTKIETVNEVRAWLRNAMRPDGLGLGAGFHPDTPFEERWSGEFTHWMPLPSPPKEVNNV